MWQAELANDWELCHQFLSATPDLAAWTLASDGVTACDVIEHADGTFVGIDRLHGETFDVCRSDLAICKLNIGKLSRSLMPLLGGRPASLIGDAGGGVVGIGRLPAKLGAVAIYFCPRSRPSIVAGCGDDRRSEIGRAGAIACSVPAWIFRKIEQRFNITIIAADEWFCVNAGEIVVNQSTTDELRHRLGLGDDARPTHST